MFSPIIGLGFSKGGKKRVNIPEIIEKHVQQGAKEFFCGYNPPYWHNKFGFEVSPNGRFAEHEQITDFESLKEIVEEVHKHGKKIMGNINHWYYSDIVWDELERMIKDFMEAGVDGFIVASFGVLEYLDSISEGTWEHGYIINGKKYHLNISTIMAVYNQDAIEFLKENYPIHKVIFSREVTLKEYEQISKLFPELLFEMFGEGDFCRYNNGLCFAEHKYTDRDICTIVVNDLIVKKAINYDYRKIIQDETLSNNEKAQKFDNEYIDEFESLKNLLDNYILEGKSDNLLKIKELLELVLKKHIIYFDPLQGLKTKHNQNFQTIYEAVEILKDNNIDLQVPYFENIENLWMYLQTEKKLSYQKYLKNLQEFMGGKFGVEAKYKDDFYNRSDNLNLFSYIFFDKFENLDTVKFPTRGRNYLPKIQLIDECVKNPEKIYDNLSLNDVPERAHYDLKYLFGNDKYRFYEIRKKLLGMKEK